MAAMLSKLKLKLRRRPRIPEVPRSPKIPLDSASEPTGPVTFPTSSSASPPILSSPPSQATYLETAPAARPPLPAHGSSDVSSPGPYPASSDSLLPLHSDFSLYIHPPSPSPSATPSPSPLQELVPLLPKQRAVRRRWRYRTAKSEPVPKSGVRLVDTRRARQRSMSPSRASSSSPRRSRSTSTSRHSAISTAGTLAPALPYILQVEQPPGFFAEPSQPMKPEDQPPSGLHRRLAKGYDAGFEDQYDDRPLEVYCHDGPAPAQFSAYYPSPSTSSSTISPRRKSHQPPVVVVPNLLPLATIVYRASAASASSASFVSSKFGEHTYYRELLDARTDAEFEAVKNRLVREWTYIGTFLVAKIAVDATVLGYGSGLNITVNAFSLRALVISAISAALGLAVSGWFLFRCWCTNLHGFKALAEGQDPVYIFFCLASRLPVLLSLISIGSLTFVVVVVAYHVFASAAVVMCSGVWILLNLHYVWRFTLGLSRAARRACVAAYSSSVDFVSSARLKLQIWIAIRSVAANT